MGWFQVPDLESGQSIRRGTVGKYHCDKHMMTEGKKPYPLLGRVCATLAGARSSFRVSGAGLVL